MFFKVSNIKNSAIFTGKHMCWGLSLIKLQVERSATFLKLDSNTGVSSGYYKVFKNSFLIQHLRWLLLTVPSRYSKVSWGDCSLISRFHVLSILIKNFLETLHRYFFTITWQNNFFVAWIDWSRTFDLRIYFWKTLIASDFDKKFTQSEAHNYVISRVKILSSPAFCGWSDAVSFTLWFGKRKNAM